MLCWRGERVIYEAGALVPSYAVRCALLSSRLLPAHFQCSKECHSPTHRTPTGLAAHPNYRYPLTATPHILTHPPLSHTSHSQTYPTRREGPSLHASMHNDVVGLPIPLFFSFSLARFLLEWADWILICTLVHHTVLCHSRRYSFLLFYL